MSDVNDKEYWDERFKENWAERRGREQSRFLHAWVSVSCLTG